MQGLRDHCRNSKNEGENINYLYCIHFFEGDVISDEGIVLKKNQHKTVCNVYDKRTSELVDNFCVNERNYMFCSPKQAAEWKGMT